jgi:hypothetical protein
MLFDLKEIQSVQLFQMNQIHMETVAKLINKCPLLVDLFINGIQKSIGLSPFLINPSILKQLKLLRLDDCIYDSESLNLWSRSCVSLKYLNIKFLDTSKLIDSDIENIFISCKKLTSFETNYPVKSGILNVIVNNAQQLKRLMFSSNEFFPLDLVDFFRTRMIALIEFGFLVNRNIGIAKFSHDKMSARSSFMGGDAVHLIPPSDVTLFQQYLTLFSVPNEPQTVCYMNVPISSTMLKSLTNNNTQLRKLYVFDCNISQVIDSLREVFQKCKQLERFQYFDFYDLMTAEHLQSLFSQPTTLQNISLGCNPNITSSALVFMVQNSPLLTDLYLHKTTGLDLTTLSDYMKNVKSNVKFTIYN